jgi:MFS family permease
MTSSSRKSSICNSGNRREQFARVAEPRARAQYFLRPDAGHVPLCAQPDHRRHRLADHRPRLRRFRNLSWVIIAYLLSSTVVSPLYGKLSDIHGRRAMMLAAIGLFIAGSVVSAAAPPWAG